MLTTDTVKIEVHHLSEAEADGLVPMLPPDLLLGTTRPRSDMARFWWVGRGVTFWHFPEGHDDFHSVLRWLARNGYVADGHLPPECFEFSRRQPVPLAGQAKANGVAHQEWLQPGHLPAE